MVVALVLIGAMSCLAGITNGRAGTSDVTVARKLASQMTAEILDKHYSDPNETPVFGREGTESRDTTHRLR